MIRKLIYLFTICCFSHSQVIASDATLNVLTIKFQDKDYKFWGERRKIDLKSLFFANPEIDLKWIVLAKENSTIQAVLKATKGAIQAELKLHPQYRNYHLIPLDRYKFKLFLNEHDVAIFKVSRLHELLDSPGFMSGVMGESCIDFKSPHQCIEKWARYFWQRNPNGALKFLDNLESKEISMHGQLTTNKGSDPVMYLNGGDGKLQIASLKKSQKGFSEVQEAFYKHISKGKNAENPTLLRFSSTDEMTRDELTGAIGQYLTSYGAQIISQWDSFSLHELTYRTQFWANLGEMEVNSQKIYKNPRIEKIPINTLFLFLKLKIKTTKGKTTYFEIPKYLGQGALKMLKKGYFFYYNVIDAFLLDRDRQTIENKFKLLDDSIDKLVQKSTLKAENFTQLLKAVAAREDQIKSIIIETSLRGSDKGLPSSWDRPLQAQDYYKLAFKSNDEVIIENTFFGITSVYNITEKYTPRLLKKALPDAIDNGH